MGPVLGGRANAILLAFLPVTAIDRRTEPERRILQQARSREWDRRQKLPSSPGAFLNLCEFAIRRHFVGACRFTLIGNSSRRRLWHPPIEPLRMWGTVICNAPFSLYSQPAVRVLYSRNVMSATIRTPLGVYLEQVDTLDENSERRSGNYPLWRNT